ncbi:MAG: hypothetical protein ACXVB9_20170 [Bdellovibrionota bacterium]
MKKFLMIATLTLAAGPVVHPPVARAAAKDTICQSTGIADGGYEIVVAADSKTAVLSEESIGGPRKIADMDCEVLMTTGEPDMLNNYLVCRDARNVDGGLIARLYTGGIAGFHYASIRAVTVLRGKVIEKEVQFGHLNCQR